MESEVSSSLFAGGYPSVERIASAVAAALRVPEAAPIWPALDGYLADLAARTCARHVEVTARMLRKLRTECPGPTTAEVFVWRSAALRGGLAKRTVNHYVGRLRTFAQWAERTGVARGHPCASLEPLPVHPGDLARRPRAFSEPEIAAFLDACRVLDRTIAGEPQEMCWRFLLETGLRWSEAVALDGAHLSGDVVTLPPKSAKRGKGRKVGPLPADVVEHFERRRARDPLLLGRHGGAWRDVGHRVSHRSFVTICGRAGVSLLDADGRCLTIHSLRRTFATRLLRAGVPIAHVSRLLGHGSTAFTERVYVDMTADDPVEAVRKAVAPKKRRTLEEQPGLFDRF